MNKKHRTRSVLFLLLTLLFYSQCKKEEVTPDCNLSAICNHTNTTIGNNGTATVVSSGNHRAATYLWSNGKTTATITGLVAGTYTVTVTENPSCTFVCNVNIQEQACNLSATADGTNVLCNAGTDGTATATTTGNLVPVTYLWSNSETTQSIAGLVAGAYTVTVTEVPTCTAVASYTVTEPAILTISTTTSQVTCNGATGIANAIVTGGAPPYGYLWSNGATTSNIVAFSGFYTVTVTDANACFTWASGTITEPTILVAICNHTDATSIGGADGTASVYASGGTWTYTYLWSNGLITESLSGLTAGTYSVTVTDANGCTVNCSTTVFD